eukprot:620207-Amphidinium_carterae.1
MDPGCAVALANTPAIITERFFPKFPQKLRFQMICDHSCPFRGCLEEEPVYSNSCPYAGPTLFGAPPLWHLGSLANLHYILLLLCTVPP